MAVEYLTTQELVILKLLADGVKWDTVVSNLHISRFTLNAHRRHIIDKLGAENTTNAVAVAIKSGII